MASAIFPRASKHELSVRRFAKQDREDQYASRRDYQTISEGVSTRLHSAKTFTKVLFTKRLIPGASSAVAGIGGFLLSGKKSKFTVRVTVGTELYERQFDCGLSWSRFGLGFQIDRSIDVSFELEFFIPQKSIDTWGFAIDLAHFPTGAAIKIPSLDELNLIHLLPETLFLNHSSDEIRTHLASRNIALRAGSKIELKKCSYCGRLLPVGPGQAGGFSFHKHNAKLSGHQNECRACKKWRINDSFNPRRTVDQLNESSIITRERRLLLREPEILQAIKEREGRGLKSIVWERFGRRCFYCDKLLALKEVELDHTRPLAYLWPIDEFATCLCAEHNNHKKDKFPVDFYSPSKLKQLSAITGLALAELQARAVCKPQLRRIRGNLTSFAKNCDPRAFNAIARKVREIHKDIDLWADLNTADPTLHAELIEALAARPDSVMSDLVNPDVDDLLDALEE